MKKKEGVYMVPERDLYEALRLVRKMRRKALEQGLNPIAVRIALKLALLIDDQFAAKKLSLDQLAQIDVFTVELFHKVERGD